MSKGKFRARTPTLNPESTCPVFDWARALVSVLYTTTVNQHRPEPEPRTRPLRTPQKQGEKEQLCVRNAHRR